MSTSSGWVTGASPFPSLAWRLSWSSRIVLLLESLARLTCSSPVRAQQRGRRTGWRKRACDGFPICACRLTRSLGVSLQGLPWRRSLKKTSSDLPVALQRGKNDLFKAVFRFYHIWTSPRELIRSRSPGRLWRVWCFSSGLGPGICTLSSSLWYSGTGRDTRRRGSAQNWGVADRPLDSYSSAKSQLLRRWRLLWGFKLALETQTHQLTSRQGITEPLPASPAGGWTLVCTAELLLLYLMTWFSVVLMVLHFLIQIQWKGIKSRGKVVCSILISKFV